MLQNLFGLSTKPDFEKNIEKLLKGDFSSILGNMTADSETQYQQIMSAISQMRNQRDSYFRALKDAGIILDSPEKMSCRNHPGSSVTRYVENRGKFGDAGQVVLYFCGECGAYDNMGDVERIIGYECPSCGIVAKSPNSVYSHSQGTGFTELKCSICSQDLGTIID